jgi:hypothetical protein
VISGLRERHGFDLGFAECARGPEVGEERGMEAMEQALAFFIGLDGFGEDAMFATVGGGFLFAFAGGGTF